MSEIITDAALVSKFAEQAMQEPEKIIETREPLDTEVELPGGFINESGQVVRTAEVKELNGADEEAIAKAGSTAKSMNVLLERGLVKLGSQEASRDDLDALLSGDRDAILLGIRKATFGKDMELRVRCNSCGDEQDAVIDFDKDIPVRKLKDSVKDRDWVVETKSGPVNVSLPNGIVQRKLMESADLTVPEVNTILLSGCVTAINGAISVGASGALSLGMSDRTKIIDSIISRNPGPRLGEVSKTCKACEEVIGLPLSLMDLFRF